VPAVVERVSVRVQLHEHPVDAVRRVGRGAPEDPSARSARRHAWANNLGEYIVTEDPGFNPNIDSNLHWEPMPQQ
jgi:hypothetical protein